MKQHYFDITSRLGNPIWWDEAGCPRYEEFHPSLCSDIYARQAALVRIGCQSCNTEMDVSFSWSIVQWMHRHMWLNRPLLTENSDDLQKKIVHNRIHYGDPPAHKNQKDEYCHGGCTMNSIPIIVLQYWEKNDMTKWNRVQDFERTIKTGWNLEPTNDVSE